jgi:hypothetical protein
LNLLGNQFTRLTVISEGGRDKHNKILWIVRCSCFAGTIKSVEQGSLRSGATKSCGCLKKENFYKLITKHGLANHPLYGTWHNMIKRCTNPEDRKYHRYGARGIYVCEEWKDVGKFIEWAGEEGLREDLTLNRIDNDGPYSPENCNWATKEEQANNTSQTYKVTFNGIEYQSFALMVKANSDLEIDVVYNRHFCHGWDLERALKEPKVRNRTNTHIYQGKEYTTKELAELTIISYETLRHRLQGGWGIERALTQPIDVKIFPSSKYDYEGKLYSFRKLVKTFSKFSENTVKYRLEVLKWDLEKALHHPQVHAGPKKRT